MSLLQLTSEILPKEYSAYISLSQQEFNQCSGLTCAAYVPFGSFSMGLQSHFYDIDLLGFYIPTHENGKVKLSESTAHTNNAGNCLPTELTHVSWLLIDYSLLDTVSKCDITYEEFKNKDLFASASFLNHGVFDYDVLPKRNSCKLASVFSDMCYYGNGKITDHLGIIRRDWEQLKKTLRIYDFCKRRFVSIKGRLEHYMVELKNVRLRSYLYSLNEICAIKYALDFREFPSPFFRETMAAIENKEVRNIALEYYELNAAHTNSKDKLLIDPNFMLNSYIGEQINQIKTRLKQLFQKDSNAIFSVDLI